MSKRGNWGPMADRVGQGGQDRFPKPPPLKHCWVIDQHGRLPGLLLEWRRTESGFQGRVVRAVHENGTEWIFVEEWLPAALLESA